MDITKLYPGIKFFKYDEDENLHQVRIKKVNVVDKTITCYDNNWKLTTIPYERLIEDYTMLKQDGIMIFLIVNVQDAKDVVITLQRSDSDDKLPFAVCRQSIYDFFTNITNNKPWIGYIGVSVSKDTCPANIKFEDVLACTGVDKSFPVAVYLDDTLDMILKFIKTSVFDKTLVELKRMSEENIKNNGNRMEIQGYCTSIKELLKLNYFMNDFRSCFNIRTLPFHIDGELEHISNPNVLFLEKELKVNIMETYLIPYSKEIDLKQIKRDYLLVADSQDEKVYILGYDKADGPYVPRDSALW